MAKFKKGESGNPAGRPVGIPDKRSEYRAALQEHADDLIKGVVEQALGGDMAAMRICIDRIVPSLKATDSNVNIKFSGDLSNQGQQVMAGIANGTLAPVEGSALMSVLMAQSKLVESDELIGRIEQLEETHGSMP